MTRHEQFWTQVQQQDGGACWLWTGAVNPQGRGMFGRKVARLFAYVEVNGPPTAAAPYVHARPTCEARCVRPDHLHASPGRRPMVPPAVRFWTHVDRSGGEDACWIWKDNVVRAPNTGLEYGLFGVSNTETVLAHRFAWVLVHGEIPEGQIVRHVACRTTRCVNVRHLALGTHRDNYMDMRADGTERKVCGARHPAAKLTEGDIQQARMGRAAGRTIANMARELGVSPTTLGDAISGRSWRRGSGNLVVARSKQH